MTIEKEKILPAGLDIPADLAETLRSLREITLLIEQSQAELTKLAQRNAAITAHLQQVQSKLDQMAPQEIRMAYDSALDAQQRLFVMHAQLDKLQSDKSHLEKYKNSSRAFRQRGGRGERRCSGARQGPDGRDRDDR